MIILPFLFIALHLNYSEANNPEHFPEVAENLKNVQNADVKCIEISEKPRDCGDIFDSGQGTNGIYRIWPQGWEDKYPSFEVYCDMTTDGGGWTVFQKRGDFGLPEDFFFKTWNEYKKGFGELTKEFWLGNDRIFTLTNKDVYELRVDLSDMEGNTVYAKYTQFWIENEDQQYRLHLEGYSGTAGDSLSAFSRVEFTTKDRKNDIYEPADTNCALLYKGGWWYSSCHSANLNGLNLRGAHHFYAQGIEWEHWKGHYYSMASADMKIRRSRG